MTDGPSDALVLKIFVTRAERLLPCDHRQRRCAAVCDQEDGRPKLAICLPSQDHDRRTIRRDTVGSAATINDYERSAAPPMLEGAVTGTDSVGQDVTVAYAGEVVLDTSIPFAIAAEELKTADAVPFSFPSI